MRSDNLHSLIYGSPRL